MSMCLWSETEDGQWATGCNILFEFNSGTPMENEFSFCPYCGREIMQICIEADVVEDDES